MFPFSQQRTFGQTCFRKRMCGLNDCKSRHHRLLHVSQQRLPQNTTNEVFCKKAKSDTKGKGEKSSERSHNTSTTIEPQNKGFGTLRTVPVITKNGNQKVNVNALLDDGSTKMYLNTDIAAESGLEGQAQKVNINVLNGQVRKCGWKC